jgi:thioredoxin reductase (NADPH)
VTGVRRDGDQPGPAERAPRFVDVGFEQAPVPTDAVVRAVVLAVDDDPDALATLESELSKRYGDDYEVWCESSPARALRRLQDRKDDGGPVALVLASHWMADIPGTELLGRAHALHPTAKRGLLISWGDRSIAEPILQAMAVGQFDYYLPKPSAPPDEGFHSIVEGFLADWAKLHGRGFTPIVIVGDPTSSRLHELRDLLTRNGVLHRVHPPASPEGVGLLQRAGIPADGRLAVFVLDGPPLIDPSIADVADALGVNATALQDEFDVVVVGAGPAGLGAAVYGASEGLRTLVVEREALGGQAGTSSLIRNFLGFPTGVSGSELAVRAYEQAWLFGARFHFMHEVTTVHPGREQHRLVLSNGAEITTRTVVLATGASYRKLGIATLDAFIGTGVFYGAAVAEAPAVAGKRVFVAGGGNSAGQAALHLAKYADQVTLLVRGPHLAQSMSEYLITQITATPNIALRTNVEVVRADGDQLLRRLALQDTRTGEDEIHEADALFILIGAQPHTDWLPPQITTDDWGFVVTGHDLLDHGRPPENWPLERPPMLLETSVPGIFAVGDTRHRSVKRVASAVGEGSIAITLIHEYLSEG